MPYSGNIKKYCIHFSSTVAKNMVSVHYIALILKEQTALIAHAQITKGGNCGC